MVTSDEERKGPGTDELPLAANDLRAEAEGAVAAPLTVSDAYLVASPGGPASQPESEPNADHSASQAAEHGVVEPEESAEPVKPPALPQGVSEPAGEAHDEDEATGRRVESLLVEAQDADPDGALPSRGDESTPFDAASAFETFSLEAEQTEVEIAEPMAPEPPTTTSAPLLSIVDPSFHQPPAQPGRPLRGRGMDRVGPIVAFDFDGTLTVRDSFTAFLKWREGSGRYHAEMAALAPAALKYLFDRDPGKLKAAAVRRFLAGLPREVLNQEAMEFAAVSAPLLFRPDALKAWRRYRQDGARLVIVTASPENIVAPFARGLGADMLIATQLIFDAEDRVQGGLLGDNCRGPVKTKRIREALGEDVVLAAAYGDTDGDWEMLEMAEQQFMRLFVGVPGKGAGPV